MPFNPDLAAQIAESLDDTVGALAPAEAAMIDPHTAAVANAYEHTLAVAQNARVLVLDLLKNGDGDNAALLRAIDRYAMASTALWLAAQQVCDTEDLPEQGEAEGIVWTVPILRPDPDRALHDGIAVAKQVLREAGLHPGLLFDDEAGR